jgi:stress-induced-phosphoprotein 1
MSVASGDNKYKQKSWVEAKELYTMALQHAENAAGLYLKKAWCEFHMGDMYESIADTGKVLKFESNNIEALELRGGNYYTLGEFDAAMNHYRQGLKFDPEHNGCKR